MILSGRYLPQAGKSKAPYRSTAPCAALKAHGASLPRLWESGKATFLSLKYLARLPGSKATGSSAFTKSSTQAATLRKFKAR